MQFDFEQGKRLDRLGKKVANPDELRIRHGSDANTASDLALERTGMAAQHLRGGDHLVCFGQQASSGMGEFHAARVSVEKRGLPQFVFECLDLGA